MSYLKDKKSVHQSLTQAALSITDALKKKLESRHLPPVHLLTFDGNPTKWPEFIENFKMGVHNKVSFTNSMRMKRLLSVLKGEAKRAVKGIGTNGIFYPIALKLLKAVQRLPNHLRHSFYKNTQIHIDPNKSLSLLQFEELLEITVHQYFNPVVNIVAS